MKGLGMGVHIPVEAEVCTDQARQVPVIFVLLHRAACAFRPLIDCNTPLPDASARPEETETQWSERQTFKSKTDLSFPAPSYKHPFLSPFVAMSRASIWTHTKNIYY